MSTLSKKHRNLYVSKQQRNLLLESEVTKKFPFLLDILEKNENVPKAMAKEFSREVQIFLENTLPEVLKEAEKEWKADGEHYDSGRVSTNCSLCGTPNKLIYYIKNRVNGTKMNVGSECITKFFDITKEITGGKNFRTHHRERLKRWQRLERLNTFNKYYPGAQKQLESWKHYYDNLPYMMTPDLDREYFEHIRKGYKLIKEFQNAARKDEVILEEYQRLVIDKHKDLVDAINSRIEKISRKKMPATKELYKWLKSNHKKDSVIRDIKTNGRVTFDTFSEVWEPNHLKSILPDLNRILSTVDVTITDINFASNSFIINHKDKHYTIPFRTLLLIIGPHFFGRTKLPLGIKTILSVSYVHDDRTIDDYVADITQLISSRNLTVSYHDSVFNDIFIVNKTTSKFVVLNLKETINNYRRYPNPDMFINKILESRNWRDVADMYESIKKRKNSAI